MSRRRTPSANVILATMAAALAMVFIDQTVLAVALPSIRRDLGMSAQEFQWVVNAYLLMLASFAVAGGRLSDLIGHSRGLAAGITIFAGASAAAGAAQSPGWLIAARLAQGAGAALLTNSTQALVSEAFPEERRGRALGIYTGSAGLALSLGPLAGGLLTQTLSWRWIFWINPIVALLLAPVVIRLVRSAPAGQRGSARRVDAPAVLLLGAALAALVLGAHRQQVVPLLAGVVLLVALVLWERRRPEPLVEPRLLRDRTVIVGLLVILLTQFVVVFGAVYLSNYMQEAMGYSPSRAGLALLPVTLLLLGGSIAGGRLTDALGARRPAIAGAVGVVAALVWLAAVIGRRDYALLVPGFVLLGASLPIAQTPMQVAIVNAVAVDRRAVSSGLQATFRQVGGVIGLAVLSGVVATGAHLSDGMRDALLTAAVVVGVALVLLVLLMPGRAARPAPRRQPPPAPPAPEGAPDPPPAR